MKERTNKCMKEVGISRVKGPGRMNVRDGSGNWARPGQEGLGKVSPSQAEATSGKRKRHL